ncbi:MAG: hypothetical protein IH853_13050, partial [Bacteroidetes bacterium]|nr:hypothetical protein [Bacteroidota bacterium]
MGKLKKEDRPRNDLTKLSEDLIDGLDTLRRSTITLRDAGALNTKALVMNDPVLLEVDWSARSEISESDLLSALKAYAPSEIEEVFDQLHPDYSPNTDEEYWNTYTDLAATKGGADQLGLLLGRLKSHRARTKVILKELNGRDVLLRAIDRIIKQPRI